jgi:hypothetical protein
MVRTAVRAVLASMALLQVAPLAGAADAQKTPSSEPWQRYYEYLRETRGGDVQPYLTDEGQAQFAGYSKEAQAAARGVLYSLPGLQDATLVKSTVEGTRAELDAILHVDPMSSGTRDRVQAHVILAQSGRGWVIVSETYTPPADIPFYATSLRDVGWTSDDGKAWTGLRAPGVFPPSVQAKADAEVRDQASGDRWAIVDVRTVVSAQAAYSSTNGGFYDRLACLHKPVACVPEYPSNAPHFLDAATASARNGYTPRFDPGPAAARARTISRSSITSYAFWMIPDEGRTGRTICGDARGIVCTVEGRTPPITKGECPSEPGPCTPLN